MPCSSRGRRLVTASCFAACLIVGGAWPVSAAEPGQLKVLFLGDQGPHHPADRFRQLKSALERRGILLTYTEQVRDLNLRKLAQFDALVVYANFTKIEPEEEQALLDYVADGKGFVALHCASACFLNSPKYIELVGAQFRRHGSGIFSTRIAESTHPVFAGYETFESWDETYVHHKHNARDRIVLEYRDDEERREPWTWVRTHGRGRVFYTAWGHDDRTWGHPGFHALVERGIRWSSGGDPGVVPTFIDKRPTTERPADLKPFEYIDATVPFYPAVRSAGTIAKPLSKMQEPLAPAESQKHYVMPTGFTVELFAAEPEIGKPLAMAWDERGRLWLAETVDYPNELQRPGEGRDRIRICEDTNGDGRADLFKIFAEQLSIPTSLAFARGGVIVTQAPQTLYLRDTDGDDVADERRVLFTGWGTFDTHAGPSNLHYGPDNWIYGIVGYSGFEGTVGGEAHSFRQGFFRFRPDGSKLEFLRSTNNNSWGVGFSEEGVLFGSTANGNPSEYMPIANRYYEQVRGWSSSVLSGIADSYMFRPITDKVRQVDVHGGFTAAAGHALYTARTYPHEYWNRTAFVCEPTGHLIATFCLQSNGAGYRSRNRWNLLASDDEWSAPIVAEVGPDGNVWVIDWYNYIVQHNPTPAGFKTGKGNAYETDLRDKQHGRVYRVVHRGMPRPAQPAEVNVHKSLAGASPERLVDALREDNMLWRLHAQRLLVERGKTDVIAALLTMVDDETIDAIGLNPGAMHALWTLHGLQMTDGEQSRVLQAALTALKHPAAGVRRAALQVMPRNATTLEAIIQNGLLRDIDGQVRLAACLALAEMPPTDSAGRAAAGALNQAAAAGDTWLLDAATAAAAQHSVPFLLALCDGPFSGDVPASVPVRERAAIVAEHFARAAPLDKTDMLLRAGTAASQPIFEAIILGLERGWPNDRPATIRSETDETLVQLLPQLTPSARGRLVSLGLRWSCPRLQEQAVKIERSLRARINDESQSENSRSAAAAELIDFRKNDLEAALELLRLITLRASPDLSRGMLEAVGHSEIAGVGNAILEHLGSITPAARSTVVRVLLSRSVWTESLLAALEDSRIQLVELSLDQKQGLATSPVRKLRDQARAILARGGGLPDPDRQKVLEELLPLASEPGDVALGKAVYVQHCAKCHIHGADGTRIGPDLTGIAVHPKHELLTNIIDPSRSVEGNYRVYSVVTKDGKVRVGLLASESKTSIELIDSEAKTHSIQRAEIDELVASTKSLMPEGFEKQVAKADLLNLLAFLSHRGRYLPLDLRRVATVVSTRGMFSEDATGSQRLICDDWSPKTFEGVPFQLVDPQGDRLANAILLYSTLGSKGPKMPRSVAVSCNVPARAIHLLSGVSGGGFPSGEKGAVSLIIRLHYDDGQSEDHALKNGEHFADYTRRVDVPGSKFAFDLRGRQLRYLAVRPARSVPIRGIEFVKGPDQSAPIVMAVTIETED